MSSDRMTLQEFADATGTSPRNVRYLLSEGVLPPPENPGGRVIFLGRDHVRAYQGYRTLQDHGLSASQIGSLAGLDEKTIDSIARTLKDIRRHRMQKEPA